MFKNFLKKIAKKIVTPLIMIAMLAGVFGTASAVNPNDLRLRNRNAANTADETRDIPYPTSGVGFLALDSNGYQPISSYFGSGLSYNSSSATLSVLNVPMSSITGLSSAMGGKMDIPTGTTGQYVDGTGALQTFPSPSDASWGSITGTLSSQTDLQTALNGKEASITGSTSNKFWNGVKSFVQVAFSDLTSTPTTLSGYGITDAVPSSRTINGNALTSNVTLTKSDVGLGNVDNTSDANKPVSTATQTALNGKQNQLNGTGFVKVSGTTVSYDNNTYLTSEVDGSTTNEIELPTQTGQSGKVLSTNGTSPSWIAASTGTVTSVTCGTGLSGGTITSTGTCSLPNTGTAGTYASVTTDAQGRVTSGTNLSFANPTRTLNSAFQISSTRATFVSYAVDIGATLTLTGGATGTVFLEYADDSGFTTNVVTVNSTANGNTGTLTVGLSLTQTATGSISGIIPAGKYVRLRTANTVGTPSFTFRTAQEVLW